MLSMKPMLRLLRFTIVTSVVLAGAVALFSAPLVAQDAASANLTALSDSDISAYRWQAMAKFHTAQADLIDLTMLSDGDISAYRWTATAAFYADLPAIGDLTMLNDGDISAYRWAAMARFYAGQPTQAAMIAP